MRHQTPPPFDLPKVDLSAVVPEERDEAMAAIIYVRIAEQGRASA